MFKFILLPLSIGLSFTLTASPEATMKFCRNFNNQCDMISCSMSPVAAEVIDTFETQINRLENELLKVKDNKNLTEQRSIANELSVILTELSELKASRDIAEAGFSEMKDLLIMTRNKLARIEALEKELSDMARVTSHKPEYRRAIDDIAIVRDRLRHLKVGLSPRAVLTVPGRYKMGESGREVDVTLRPFMVAQTHVTQGEWKQLSGGESPSKFKGDERPVENITWASMVMYTIKLNERLGLEQPLDLSQMDSSKFSGNWQDGTLDFKREESKLRVDLNKNGYRLPTDAEFEYLARNLGQSNGTYPHNLNESQLSEYSVYCNNSNNQTAAVRSKKPLLIDGREIYDLMGNVWIFMLDAYQQNLLGGDNPIQLSGLTRVLRGGSWFNDAADFRTANHHRNRYGYSPSGRGSGLGFRLLRTIN